MKLKLKFVGLIFLSLFLMVGCSSQEKIYEEVSKEVQKSGFNCPVPEEIPKEVKSYLVTNLSSGGVQTKYLSEHETLIFSVECVPFTNQLAELYPTGAVEKTSINGYEFAKFTNPYMNGGFLVKDDIVIAVELPTNMKIEEFIVKNLLK